MFLPCPNYTLIWGQDAVGVYGYYNATRSGTRDYLHNLTLPLLFNQDI
jgi:hypothetical protein